MEGLTVSAITFEVGADGRNPDGVEAHVLNVIEVIDDTLP